ncbi:DUF4003 family protein [Clostridium thermarum]|uniref:DUF4003 family protein n=1 Tax=Clostridium thermarum TaxID=1716543 RepID=UPI0013D25B52|nr:DUF4003 family protein [Clostridium thermarum]
MVFELKSKVDLMVENYNILKNGFTWESRLIKHFSAMTYALADRRVDTNRLKEVKDYIKDQTSWTSQFRGANQFILASLLSLENDYKDFFGKIQQVYDKLRNYGFKSSAYLPLAAFTIAKSTEGDWDHTIRRMNSFYNQMKKNHFWLTSHDDYVFASVLATTDLNVEETSALIESCYRALNSRGLHKGNDLQTLSHILALGEEDVETKCRKAVAIYDRLKEEKCKLEYKGLATLGLVTLISTDISKIVSEIKEVYDYIYEKEGYGFWSLDKGTRTILAATLVSDFYVGEAKKGLLQITLGNSINAIIIAQQQATIAAACAASAAAAASSSN